MWIIREDTDYSGRRLTVVYPTTESSRHALAVTRGGKIIQVSSPDNFVSDITESCSGPAPFSPDDAANPTQRELIHAKFREDLLNVCKYAVDPRRK